MGMGHKQWCFPDMYCKPAYLDSAPSHESICFANNGDREAVICITAVFEDEKEPIVLDGIRVKPMRSLHLRMDQLEQWGQQIPTDTPYSVFVESTERVVAGYGRLNWIERRMQSFGMIGYFEQEGKA